MHVCQAMTHFGLLLFLHVGQGLTGLHHAAGGGHPECFHCLLEHGADPSVCSLGGDNALDIARKRGKPRIISKASMVNQGIQLHTD
jgi:ankyrin repeat protein